jgi:hypothetical protein
VVLDFCKQLKNMDIFSDTEDMAAVERRLEPVERRHDGSREQMP